MLKGSVIRNPQAPPSGGTELSSLLTVIYKFVFPVAVCSALVVALAFQEFGIAIPFAVAVVFVLLFAAPLKLVVLDGNELVLSNFFRTCRVSCGRIVEVQDKRLLNPRLVWVFFDEPTPLGERIAFIPKWVVPQWKPHPAAEQLRELARRCRSEQPRATRPLTPS